MTGGYWYVARTNPRCEERAKASLEAAGFTVYLPMMRKEYRHNRSKRLIERNFPIFVRYLFLMMANPDQSGKTRKCDGVEAVLGDGRTPVAIPTEFVDGFREAQERGDFDSLLPREPVPHDFRKGEAVTIEGGSLAGVTGTVVSAEGKHQIKVFAELFSGMVEMTVPVEILKRVA